MKRISYVFVLVLAVFAMLLSACGAPAAASAPVSSGGGSKPMASPVEFTGVIEAMNGNEWTIGGQTLTVDPAVVRDGPFVVGDTVKVEVQVQGDGSTVVSRIESPVAANSNDDNSNGSNSNDDNGNDSNSNDDNGNDSNSNDDNSNDSNSNDDDGDDSNSNDDSSNDNGSRDDNSGGGQNDDSGDDHSGNGGGGDDNSGGGGGGSDDSGGGGDDSGGDDD